MSDMRTDIIANDVFISWTGKDAEIKDKVKKCLQAKGLNCTDSQCDCAGNYVEWSKQAATASHIMVLILTENSFKSKYQKTELQEVKKKKAFGADFSNRLVTFCPSQKIYDGEKFGENGEHLLADNYNSAAYFGEDVTQDALDGLADKVINLLLGRTFEIYKAACEASEKKIGLLSFFVDQQIGNTSVDYDKIYIERSVKDSDGKELSAQELLARGDLLLVYGPSGMGKTEYIKQLRRAVDPEVLTAVVRCSDLWRSDKTVYEYLCENVAKGVQNAAFTDKHFERLWDSRDRLVVFDGLDEVPTTASTNVFLQKIGEFCSKKVDDRRTQILFTSRNKDDANRFANDPTDIKSQLRSFELQPLNDDQIEKLCASLGKVFEFDGGDFFFKIKSLDKEIKTNPLLVSQLAIINNNYGEIPSDSMEMTEKLAEIIFGVEDNAKVLEVKGAKITDLRALVEAFAALKYEYPEDGDGDVMGEALKSCKERAVPAKVLEYFKKRAIYVDGRYLHKSLGEFFAAYGFARRACGLGGEVNDNKLLDLVISHCGDESWGSIVNYFVRKTELKTLFIPDGVTSIGSHTFAGCRLLESIEISDSVTSIGFGAFSGCSSLESVTIGNGVTSIGTWVFACCSSLTSITIPDSVTSIGEDAFYDCSSLTSIVIPESVTSIGERAFYGCRSLTSIIIPDSVTSIGKGTFDWCSSLTSITIGGGVTSIGERAFYGCSSLTSITIPDSVTSIGEYAFSDCSSLTSITIPDSVTSIGVCAFYGCSLLESIVVKEGNAVYHSEGNCLIKTDSKTLIAGCKSSVIPSDGGLTSIGKDAFRGCDSLTSITIGGGITSIGERAFLGCSSLTSITIPDSVTSIGNYAFYDCDSLDNITIPDSVTSIGDLAFFNCSSLESIVVEEGNAVYHSDGNCIIETESKTLIAGCKNSIIPNDGSVTSIGDGAFRGCDSLTSIVIPDSVTSIGDSAFDGCDSLASITIPDSVTSIGDYAFSWCTSLESITIGDGVTSIGARAFNDCDSLESVTIGNGVTSIGEYAFYGCSSLKSITIPDSVTSIGVGAFSGCTNLIQTENGVSYIDKWGIDVDSSLTQVHLRDNTVGIADSAFSGCDSLTSITIPDGVTSIGGAAFAECDSLTSINFQGSMEQWKAIDKDTEWNLDAGSYTVICTDGTLDKNGDQI